MRSLRTFLVSFYLLVGIRIQAQQTKASVPRDPQAVAIVQSSLAAMAGSIPADSSAAGIVTVIEGSTTQSGSIQILTLGTAQTAETLVLPDGTRTVVYSNLAAREAKGAQSVNPPLETVVTDQCPDFPLPFLLSAFGDSDAAFRYVGQETLNSVAVHHLQIWNTFTSNSYLLDLASFSLKDAWFDASSGLPLKISYTRRLGGGAALAVPVEVSFANYTKVAGVLYPFLIQKSLNGVPWQTITIQNVALNTGLTGLQFQVE